MSKGWGVLSTALALAALLLLPSPAAAAGPGEPDPSFSGDGFALADIQANPEEANGVAEAPDGKIIVGGWAIKNSPLTYIPFLVRLLPDGTLDPSFGTNGIRTYSLPCGGGQSPINSVHVLPDGKILTAGACGGNFALLRFDSEGNLDPSFDGDPGNPGGGNGIVESKFAFEAAAYQMVVDPSSGAITLGGLCCTGVAPSYQDAALARYDSEGKLDTNFDGPSGTGNGKVVLPMDPTFDDSVVGMADAGAGRVAIAGERKGAAFVALIGPDGKPMPSFSGDGIADIDHVTQFDKARAVGMDAAGDFVVASEAGDILATKIVVNRLDAAGNLDMGFGAPTFDPTPGLGSLPENIVMQPDGGILVVGISYVEPFPKTFEYGKLDVIRLLPGGQPDASFGPGGIRVFSGPQGGAIGLDGTLDRAGRLLVSGMSFVYPPQSPYTDDALVARILTMPPAPPPVPIASARATIKFAGFKRNRRKGTGTLFVVVSKAGTIKLAGTKKLRGFSTKAGKAGKFALKVRARGKARKRLLALADRRGLARLKALAKVSYLPSGEASLTLQRRVKLVKRG